MVGITDLVQLNYSELNWVETLELQNLLSMKQLSVWEIVTDCDFNLGMFLKKYNSFHILYLPSVQNSVLYEIRRVWTLFSLLRPICVLALQVRVSHTSWFQLSWTQFVLVFLHDWMGEEREYWPGVKFHLNPQRQTRVLEAPVSRGWVMNVVTEADWDFPPPHPEASKEIQSTVKQNWLTVFLCSSAL